MICQFKCRDDIKKDVVDSLNNTYFFQKGERRPLIAVGWSLGCCILSEALNIIKAQNEMAELSNEPDAKVEIDKVILLSPAWYINDIQGLLSSFLCNQKYETKES